MTRLTVQSSVFGKGSVSIRAPPQPLTIAEKELIPIILACDTWGRTWQGKRILCHCDNQAVVACLHSRSSKQEGMMHLLRCLAFVEAQNQCHLHPTYIDTRSNHLADDLSRDNMSSFLAKVPEADSLPARVSRPLLNTLLDRQADWMSPSWRRQFRLLPGWPSTLHTEDLKLRHAQISQVLHPI